MALWRGPSSLGYCGHFGTCPSSWFRQGPKSSGGSGFLDIVKFVVIAIAFAVVITWVFNNTKGSVLMAILVHASIDTFKMPMATLFSPSAMATSILVSYGA